MEGLYLALTEPDAVGHAFNLASARPTPHDEGAAAIADAYGVPKLMIELPMAHHLELDIHRARTLLGFEPAYDFTTMIRDASPRPSN